MGFFSNFRENRRLAESVEYWRGKADEREAKIQELNALLLSQSLVFTDKILIATRQFPASLQIRQDSVDSNITTETILADKKREFLNIKRLEVQREVEQAEFYGKPADADKIYTDRMPEFEQEFLRKYPIS